MTFLIDRLSNPEFVSENCLPPHSDHLWYPAPHISNRPPYRQSLDGVWKFHYAINPADSPQNFESTKYDCSSWDNITVPGHIQLQGYDRPQYVNVQYPWDGQEQLQPGQLPTKFNPVGCYVKNFSIDQLPTNGERLSLQFDGAESSLAVWLNGEYVGYSEDSFTPAEFDITGLVQTGNNKLALQVFKWCSGSWLEDQDFFRFSGLFRSVYLVRRPSTHVEDIRVEVDLNADLSIASVVAKLEVHGPGSVTVSLEGEAKTLTLNQVSTITQPDDIRLLELATKVESPQLWSAENPFLYRLTIEVSNDTGEVVEYIPVQVGIRRFQIEDGMLKINGKRVVFNGVNRHEFGLNGRTVTKDETEKDLIALKRAGINAIRTSHYPNNSFFYELCDQYGFYVIDEMNLETHGIWDQMLHGDFTTEMAIPGDNPAWLPAVLERASNMYHRDKNHPSIVMWSCGNESFGGANILAVADYFRERDSRPVHYEGIFWDGRFPETTDVVSQMYTPAADVEAFLKSNRTKPFILCEYAHAMGNSFGAVDRYVELAYREPLFQGGFIWDFADQAITLKDQYGNDYFGYGGDCGEFPHDGDFCGNGIFFADHTPTPRIQEVKHVYRQIVTSIDARQVTISNRFLFTDTSAFDCSIVVYQGGAVLQTIPLETAVAPGGQGNYALPDTALAKLIDPAEEYSLEIQFALRQGTSWAKAGYVIASDQRTFEPTESASSPALISSLSCAKIEVIEGIHNIGVRSELFAASFSRQQGGLQGYSYGPINGGKNLFKSMPMPNFWHAPTSNEQAWGAPFADGEWLLASRYAKFKWTENNPELTVENNQVTITFTYELPTHPSTTCTVAYTVTAEGKITVKQSMPAVNTRAELPEFGMLFKVSNQLAKLTWYGDGPDESYVDRRGGARLGIYESTVRDQMVPYLLPQECANHTDVRWATVTDASGAGLRFEAQKPMEFSALPWTPFEVENATHPNELPPIHNTIIRPALMRRGIAGDDTWGARPHPEFLLPQNVPLEFEFSFQGIV